MQWVKPRGKSALPETAWQAKDLLPRLKQLPSKGLLHMLHTEHKCSPRILCVQWVKPRGKSALPETAWQAKDLLPRLKRLPSKRLLHVPNTTLDALDFRLFFDPSAQLPPGFSKPELGTWTVSGEQPARSALGWQPVQSPCASAGRGFSKPDLGVWSASEVRRDWSASLWRPALQPGSYGQPSACL